MDIPIIYEDNHLLVVEKPVNIPVQEDRSQDKDLLSLLKQDIKIRYQKPGNVYLGLVHRLDRPVGGVMVFAKTSKAASRLSDMVRRRVFEKSYLAIVRGRPAKAEGRLTDYLVKNRQKNIVYVTQSDHKEAKKAVLDYRVIGTKNDLSLVQIQLHTGRSHQIRVQFANIGCPLYGDQKYGQHVNQPGEQIALWSSAIAFQHPTKKDTRQFTSTPPNVYPWHLWPHLWS